MLDARFLIGGLPEKFFSLLSAIEEKGSLIAAAKRAGLSYKGAWDMLERAGQLSPRPLIESSAGGGKARGTRLTVTGRRLLEIHRALEIRKQALLRQLNEELASDPIVLQWYRRLILKSSTRNQWRAEVLSLKKGVVTQIVTLRLPGGAQLSASFPEESLTPMRLEHGTAVIAMVKAPMIHLVAQHCPLRFAAENQFDGRVVSAVLAGSDAEVRVLLETQDEVVSVLSLQEWAELEVQEGDPVRVMFDAEAVLLATALS